MRLVLFPIPPAEEIRYALPAEEIRGIHPPGEAGDRPRVDLIGALGGHQGAIGAILATVPPAVGYGIPAEGIEWVEADPSSVAPIPDYVFPGEARPVRALLEIGGPVLLLRHPDLARACRGEGPDRPPQRPPEPAASPELPDEEAVSVVTFQVGESRVAVPATEVQEVRRAEGIVPVPFTPPVLSGIIRAGAIAVPVYDPGRSGWPNRSGGAGEAGDHILVLRRGETLSGLRVSRPDTAELKPGPPRPGGGPSHPLEVGSWYGDGGTFARVELDGLLRLLGIPTEGGS